MADLAKHPYKTKPLCGHVTLFTESDVRISKDQFANGTRIININKSIQ